MNFSDWYTNTHNDWWHEDYLDLPVFTNEMKSEYLDWCKENRVTPIGIPN